jgi:hypothetical protein
MVPLLYADENSDDLCNAWAARGECEQRPEYFGSVCCASCPGMPHQPKLSSFTKRQFSQLEQPCADAIVWGDAYFERILNDDNARMHDNARITKLLESKQNEADRIQAEAAAAAAAAEVARLKAAAAAARAQAEESAEAARVKAEAKRSEAMMSAEEAAARLHMERKRAELIELLRLKAEQDAAEAEADRVKKDALAKAVALAKAHAEQKAAAEAARLEAIAKAAATDAARVQAENAAAAEVARLKAGEAEATERIVAQMRAEEEAKAAQVYQECVLECGTSVPHRTHGTCSIRGGSGGDYEKYWDSPELPSPTAECTCTVNGYTGPKCNDCATGFIHGGYSRTNPTCYPLCSGQADVAWFIGIHGHYGQDGQCTCAEGYTTFKYHNGYVIPRKDIECATCAEGFIFQGTYWSNEMQMYLPITCIPDPCSPGLEAQQAGPNGRGASFGSDSYTCEMTEAGRLQAEEEVRAEVARMRAEEEGKAVVEAARVKAEQEAERARAEAERVKAEEMALRAQVIEDCESECGKAKPWAGFEIGSCTVGGTAQAPTAECTCLHEGAQNGYTGPMCNDCQTGFVRSGKKRDGPTCVSLCGGQADWARVISPHGHYDHTYIHRDAHGTPIHSGTQSYSEMDACTCDKGYTDWTWDMSSYVSSYTVEWEPLACATCAKGYIKKGIQWSNLMQMHFPLECVPDPCDHGFTAAQKVWDSDSHVCEKNCVLHTCNVGTKFPYPETIIPLNNHELQRTRYADVDETYYYDFACCDDKPCSLYICDYSHWTLKPDAANKFGFTLEDCCTR